MLPLLSCSEKRTDKEAEIAVAKATPNVAEPATEVVNGLYGRLGSGDDLFLAGDYVRASDDYVYVKSRIDSLRDFHANSGGRNRLAGTSLAIENRLLLLDAAIKLGKGAKDGSR